MKINYKSLTKNYMKLNIDKAIFKMDSNIFKNLNNQFLINKADSSNLAKKDKLIKYKNFSDTKKLRTELNFHGYTQITLIDNNDLGESILSVNGFALFLDDKVLILYENTEDDYRSYASELICMTFDDFKKEIGVKHYNRPIEPGVVSMFGYPENLPTDYSMNLGEEAVFFRTIETFGFYCKYTDQKMLEIGTNYGYDFYPEFVFEYFPETIHNSYILDGQSKLESRLSKGKEFNKIKKNNKKLKI